MMLTRPLNADDVEAYKKLRLHALDTELKKPSETFEQEQKFSDQQWIERCTETPDRCLFGLFDNDRLVGMLLSKKWEGDKSGHTAYWGHAYIHPNYRGHGEGKPLYELREKWSTEHGFNRAVFSFLDQNRRSMEIHIKRGAKYMYTEHIKCHDGLTEPWHWFEVDFPPRPEFTHPIATNNSRYIPVLAA